MLICVSETSMADLKHNKQVCYRLLQLPLSGCLRLLNITQSPTAKLEGWVRGLGLLGWRGSKHVAIVSFLTKLCLDKGYTWLFIITLSCQKRAIAKN